MKHEISEQELRQDRREARLRPETDARAARIYRATKSIVDEGEVYFVLTDTPEQTSDIFRVLVDDRLVVAFELDRSDDAAVPTETKVYSVEEYRKAIGGGLAETELRIATELAREALNH
jgi:hypothetical protein